MQQHSGKRTKDGISATEDCLATCLAGVINKQTVHDLLATMHDSKIIVLDEDQHGNVRLQLPFNGASSDEFPARLAQNDKKYTRYQMFSKDGVFAQEFEKKASDENDAVNRRMKIAVCCAETSSINNRLAEIAKELNKSPYKLGLLLVTVNSDAQGVSIQSMLQSKTQEMNEPRLTIALVREPFTDEKRKKWLTAITKQEMASVSGQTGASNQYNIEANAIMTTWISSAVSGGKMIAYNGDTVFNNQYGMAQLRKTIRTNVLDRIFPFAPENIVITNTAFKACNESAPTAGIQRNTTNSQLKNVINSLKNEGILDIDAIGKMSEVSGSRAKECIAALAKLIRNEMESGSIVNLGDLWASLQKEPYGYYDTIACGILLGYVFSCYKNSKYTWTDSAQSPHVLAEATLGKMVVNMCKGRMTTDYLSAGSITWQHFSDYLREILDLSVAQVAEQTTGYHNAREAITKSGAPFWALKYLPADYWTKKDFRTSAENIIDNFQVFISQEGDVETAMSNVLQLMSGKGKIKVNLEKAFKDKNIVSAAFRTFLFSISPELKDIATKLDIQPEELSDKIHNDFVLLTKRFRNVSPTNGNISIHVISDTLNFIQQNMEGASVLTNNNCTDEMQKVLFEYALKGIDLNSAILQILNMSSFSGQDIMGKWKVLDETHKHFVDLWFKLYPDNTYLSHCFTLIDNTSDLTNILLHEIFKMWADKPDWVREYRVLLQVMKITPDEQFFEELDSIPFFEKRLDFIVGNSRNEQIYGL